LVVRNVNIATDSQKFVVQVSWLRQNRKHIFLVFSSRKYYEFFSFAVSSICTWIDSFSTLAQSLVKKIKLIRDQKYEPPSLINPRLLALARMLRFLPQCIFPSNGLIWVSTYWWSLVCVSYADHADPCDTFCSLVFFISLFPSWLHNWVQRNPW
jgi:hypothetical protein